MKIRWGVLTFFVLAALGAFFQFAYRGPERDTALGMLLFLAVFLLFSWNGVRSTVLKRRLRKEGFQGTARLLRADPTGFRSGSDPGMKLTLSVAGQGGETWEATVRQVIPQYQLYMMAPGTLFNVLYDPHDRSKVILDDQRQGRPAVRADVTVTVTGALPSQAPQDPTARRAYQDMMAKQDAISQRLLATGTVTQAKVLTCVPLHATMNNKDPLMLLMLEVQPQYEPTFTGQVVGCLDSTRLDRFASGSLIYVRYDSADKTQIALVGSEKPGGL